MTAQIPDYNYYKQVLRSRKIHTFVQWTSTNVHGSKSGGRCCICARQMLCMQSADSTHWQHFSAWNDVKADNLVTSKSDFINRCVFTWRIFLPSFIRIRLERMEPSEEVAPKKKNNKNMSNDVRSVPNPTTTGHKFRFMLCRIWQPDRQWRSSSFKDLGIRSGCVIV